MDRVVTIPKKLELKRDELAHDRCVMPWTTLESDEERKEYFNQGFNAACNLLLPEIKKLEEALKKITKTKYGLQGYTEENDVQGERDYLANLAFGYEQIARDTLQSLREFLGEESGGE